MHKVNLDNCKLNITHGPQSWAIIQQEDGVGSILLAGNYRLSGSYSLEYMEINVKVIAEQTGLVVAYANIEVVNEEGEWELKLANIPIGGLYRIECIMRYAEPAYETIIGEERIEHIGIGDIWLIAGQSNAEGAGRGYYNEAPELGVHLFRSNGKWDLATHPFQFQQNLGHSPFLAFAKIIKKHVHTPIGFIQTAVAATSLKLWNPLENGSLYRNMLSSIQQSGGKIRGVLWYQGETDALWYGYSDGSSSEPDTYLERFKQMVLQFRADLLYPELPFLTVQLNRCSYEDHPEANRSWGTLREMQRQAPKHIAGVYVVPALECALSDEVHNGTNGNLLLADRLANMALSEIYGLTTAYKAPDIYKACMSHDLKEITLYFQNIQGSLYAPRPAAKVFAVEDERGDIEVESWSIADRSRIVLALARAATTGNVKVHGAYEVNPAFMLPIDTLTGLPILAFYQLHAEEF